MLTKYILHIGGDSYELQDDELRNWDEIKCSCKRSSYDGIVRSFTSKFEFVNGAYEILLKEYLKNRFNADAMLEVFTMNDRWEFDKQFECPLDFSTAEWENGVFSVNAVDNTLAALIKANKSTKYEFLVGYDVPTSKSLFMTRIPMVESLIYGFTQGTTYEDKEDIRVTFQRGELPWVGNKDSEIAINQTIYWKDDQETDPGSYILKATKNAHVNVAWNFRYLSNQVTTRVAFKLKVKRGNTVVMTRDCGACDRTAKHLLGRFSSSSMLPDLSEPIYDTNDTEHNTDLRQGGYAIVGDSVYETYYGTGMHYLWRDTGKTEDEYFIATSSGTISIDLQSRDVLYMEHVIDNSSYQYSEVLFKSSEFVFDWLATGDDVTIGVMRPVELGRSILNAIAGETMRVHVDISGYDSRIANTYLMAAESIREIPGAKLYTSFNEFCDWMSAVFGYVYYIGEPQSPKYTIRQDFGRMVSSNYTPDGFYSGEVSTNNIYYDSVRKIFFYNADSGYYATWPGYENYNDPDTGHPRTDTIFRAIGESGNPIYVFPAYTSDSYEPVEYDDTDDIVGDGDKTVYFVHRSELFKSDAPVRVIKDAREVKHSADSGAIYATVTAGYEKKDYENTNGRDEFNFNNTYTTGCTVTDKTLSLISKYRADCYGIEFAIQKRSQDTTDTTSDKDVFFVLCKEQNHQLIVDRTCQIENSLTGTVFNGAFSPAACIRANAGYIGMQADTVHLKFASSEGNSNVVIDDIPLSSDLTLDTPIGMAGTIEFATGDVDLPDDGDIIQVTDSGGTVYRGFLKEVDIRFAREEAAKYKLIAKDIEL